MVADSQNVKPTACDRVSGIDRPLILDEASIKEAVSTVQRSFKKFMSLDHQLKQPDAQVLRNNILLFCL